MKIEYIIKAVFEIKTPGALLDVAEVIADMKDKAQEQGEVVYETVTPES